MTFSRDEDKSAQIGGVAKTRYLLVGGSRPTTQEEFEFFLSVRGCEMQCLSEEDDNRDVYDALAALVHVQESPLQDVTFESMVATLPVVIREHEEWSLVSQERCTTTCIDVCLV